MSSQRTVVLLAVALLARSSADLPARAEPSRLPPPPRLGATEWRERIDPAPRGATLLRQAMLDEHNRARAELALPPLAWDETLARAADTYARALARAGRLAHAAQPRGGERQGENLFAGTRDAYTYAEMVRWWLDERAAYVDAPAPRFSRTGRWQDAVHYAQIVWRGTARLGCALAAGGRDDVLVCRYAPAGAAVGATAY
ncbi:CAP domain-containing protein [Sphingomonas folli]|uniref:CAP domain-containing protein n=1 Tax=Sphingomonas folli TaxID=2862497 RepID=UPI0027E40484|nr:CAP domain-containing protein [Sphingomonas folli]